MTTPVKPQPDPARCGAVRKGKTCTLAAGHGTNHPGAGRCKHHGGSSPAGELNAGLTLARREFAVMGIPISVEPHAAILECIAIAAGEVAYAGDRISELAPDEAIVHDETVHERPRKFFGGAEAPSGDEAEDEQAEGTYSSARVTETKRTTTVQLNVWIRVRQAAMDRLVNYSAVAIKNGIEERRVKIAESQAALMAQAIRGILDGLGVGDDPRAPAIVAQHLRLVAGGAPE